MVLEQEGCGFLLSHYRARLQDGLQVPGAVLTNSILINCPKDIPVVPF